MAPATVEMELLHHRVGYNAKRKLTSDPIGTKVKMPLPDAARCFAAEEAKPVKEDDAKFLREFNESDADPAGTHEAHHYPWPDHGPNCVRGPECPCRRRPPSKN